MNQIISNGEIYINGEKLPDCPNNNGNNSVTIINNHVFKNGYEYHNGEWKKTLKALYYLYF